MAWPSRAGPHPRTRGTGPSPPQQVLPYSAPLGKKNLRKLSGAAQCQPGPGHDLILPEWAKGPGSDLILTGHARLKCHLSKDGSGALGGVEGTRLYMLLLEAGGPLPSDVPAAPSPPPQLCRPAPCRKVAAGPGQRPRGGPRAEPGQGSETRCLPPSTIFVCSIKGGREREGESCEGRGQWRGGSGEGDQERDSWTSC